MSRPAQTFNESRLEIPSPSVDSLGRITYVPKAKGYKPANQDLVGKQIDMITCLNTSEVIFIK